MEGSNEPALLPLRRIHQRDVGIWSGQEQPAPYFLGVLEFRNLEKH